MSSEKSTSHYEYFSDLLNIMIYGIEIKDLFPMAYDLPTSMMIDEMVSDIIVKKNNTLLSKKAIVLYHPDRELLHIK